VCHFCCNVFFFCSKQCENAAASKWTSIVEQHGRHGVPGNSDNAPASAVSLPQLEAEKDQPRPSIASASQEEVQLKQQVVKRLEKEEALILEDVLELEKIKKEAEEKLQDLNKTIISRKAKVEILKDLLEN